MFLNSGSYSPCPNLPSPRTNLPLLRPNHPYPDRIYPKYEFVIFRDELVEFLESVSNEPLAGRADEVEGKITVTGKFYDFVEDFLYERGF